MKFWKNLSALIEDTLPDWRDKFLSYKDLKKQLKLIYPKDDGKRPDKRCRLDHTDRTNGGDCAEENEVWKEVIDFKDLLKEEIEKFNAFFEEKEEEYVIRWKELQDRVAKSRDLTEELMKVRREIVDFHGEMVLLENYSALNCIGLVKILKKYDKLSGALTRMPFIQEVLQEPFFKTDLLNQLVKECNTTLDHLFSKESSSSTDAIDEKGVCDSASSIKDKERTLEVPKELAEIEHMENMYMKLTLSALSVLQKIRSESSTVNMFSLPPLHSNAMNVDWKKTTVLEEVAK